LLWPLRWPIIVHHFDGSRRRVSFLIDVSGETLVEPEEA
jgi:hypothetical protein